MSQVPSLLTALRLPLLAMLATAMLAGCGFQLRGSSPVPATLQPLAVDCPDSLPGRFCQSVRDQLRLGGVELKDAASADYVLRLRNYQQDRRASAITAQAAAAEIGRAHV